MSNVLPRFFRFTVYMLLLCLQIWQFITPSACSIIWCILIFHLQDQSNPAIQLFTGVTVTVHENYTNDMFYDFDIAIIRLPTALNLNDYVQPVCLPSSPVPAATSCVVAGWSIRRGKQNRTFGICTISY